MQRLRPDRPLTRLVFLLFGLGLLAAGLLLPGRASAQGGAQDFTIKRFDADYYLDRASDKTSTVKVVERIIAQFPEFDQNHGILRAIPKTYQDHTVSLDVESVV